MPFFFVDFVLNVPNNNGGAAIPHAMQAAYFFTHIFDSYLQKQLVRPTLYIKPCSTDDYSL